PSPKSSEASDSSSDSTSSAPSSAAPTGNVTAHPSVGEDTEDKADTKTDTETDETTSEEPGTEKESEPTDEPTSPKGDDVNLGEPEGTTKHVETGGKSNDNPTGVAARPAPARYRESAPREGRATPAETAQPLSLRADPQRFAVQALSATTAL